MTLSCVARPNQTIDWTLDCSESDFKARQGNG